MTRDDTATARPVAPANEEAHREQTLIDAEVWATRRRLVAVYRDRLRTVPETLDGDLLTVADRPALHTAIITAAESPSVGCGRQTHHRPSVTLPMVRQRGLRPAVIRYLETGEHSPTRRVLNTHAPVLVDDVTLSPMFTGQPVLRVMLEAGFRAVHAYPLRDARHGILGVLSLHHRTAGPAHGPWRLISASSRALAHLAAPEPNRAPAHASFALQRSAAGVTTISAHGPWDALAGPDGAAVIERAVTILTPVTC